MSRLYTQHRPWAAMGLLAAAAILAIIAIAYLNSPGPVLAQENPPGCTSNAASTSLTPSPAGFVQHGTVITYTARFTNLPAGSACSVINVDSQLTLPNGSTIQVLTDATLVSGDDFTCPSADVRCAAGPYQYTVAHADEIGTFSGCPPVEVNPTAAPRVVAYLQSTGDTLTEIGDFFGDCKTATSGVIHTPLVTTEVHNPAHEDITNTSIALGSTVHDEATVTAPEAGLPVPQGTVDFTLFASNCQPNTVISTQNNVTLVNGVVESNDFTPLTTGTYGYLVHYDGQTGVYTTADGICEPFNVVDARILLAPPQDANEVGTNHTFTCHIQIDLGAGFVDAPAGTNCDLDILPGGVGAFDPAADDSCLTIGTTGQCPVDITSGVTGVTVVRACTEEDQATPGLTVDGVLFSRCTTAIVGSIDLDNCAPVADEGPTDAVKCWVDAEILLAPPQDANEVGTNHTFTCHIRIDQGDGLGFVNAPAGTTCDLDIVSGVGDFDPANDDSCLTIGTTGACPVDITSPVTGNTVVRACTEEDQGTPGLTVLTVALTRCTTAVVGPIDLDNCAPVEAEGPTDAVKCWVNARIFLAPPQDDNEVGTNHTFTCHIQIDQGDGLGFVDAPAGTTCDLDIISGVGAFDPAGIDACTTIGATGQCPVDITSDDAGTTVVRACTEENQATPGLTVLTVALTRCTTAIVGPVDLDNCVPVAAESATDAVKCWVDAKISITPDGNNPLNVPHTFTCHIEVDTGDGVDSDGNGSTFDPAPEGTTCRVTVVSGSELPSPQDCLTIGATGSCTVTTNSGTVGQSEVQACTVDLTVLTVAISRCTLPRASDTTPFVCPALNTTRATPEGFNAVKCRQTPGECFVLWDEEAMDNDFRSVERAARKIGGITPDALINDIDPWEDQPFSGDEQLVLRWNEIRAASALVPGTPEFEQQFVVRIPTGQPGDEGWFFLDDDIDPDLAARLANGTASQSELDKIPNVQPLRNEDLATLVGMTCVALIYDSDISMNYNPRNANLQGEKYGLFTFTILDVVMPQSGPTYTADKIRGRIPESTSSTSLFDVIIQVEPPATPDPRGYPTNDMQQPDTVAILSARCRNGELTVTAETSFKDPNGFPFRLAELTIAVEGLAGYAEEDRNPMDINLGGGRFREIIPGVDCSTTGLRGKVVTVSSDGGFSGTEAPPGPPVPGATGKWGSGGNYNARING